MYLCQLLCKLPNFIILYESNKITTVFPSIYLYLTFFTLFVSPCRLALCLLMLTSTNRTKFSEAALNCIFLPEVISLLYSRNSSRFAICWVIHCFATAFVCIHIDFCIVIVFLIERILKIGTQGFQAREFICPQNVSG